MNVFGGWVEGAGGGTYRVHNIPHFHLTAHLPLPSRSKGVTLSGRFTVAASSDAADDRALSPSSFIRKKNGGEQLGADRTKLSISAVIMHNAADISCCHTSYCAESKTCQMDATLWSLLFKNKLLLLCITENGYDGCITA